MSEESFTIYLKDFRVLHTGADGGHRYISTVIDYGGRQRPLTAFFARKEDEDRLDENNPVIIKGNLLDEGGHQPLLLMNAEIVIEEPKEE
jgi:hypothetical protein